VRLSSRGVSRPTDYVVCSSNYEGSIHTLFECMFAIQVWRVTHVWDRIDNVLREDYNMYAMIFTLTSTTNIIE